MRILLAVDGSPPSDFAVRALASRPWPKGSAVRILSAVKDIYVTVPDAALAMSYDQMMLPLLEEAQARVARLAESLRDTGLAVETKVVRGDPRVEIIDDARAWSADLIVLGSHGRTGLKRWVLGSVAEYVVRHGPCSVEVTRDKKEDRAP